MSHQNHKTPDKCHVKSLLQIINDRYIKYAFGKQNPIIFEQEYAILRIKGQYAAKGGLRCYVQLNVSNITHIKRVH